MPERAADPPDLSADLAAAGPVILYDGVCGLCNGFVRFVLRWDRRQRLRFATIQGKYGDAARERYPELRGIDSIVFVNGKTHAVKSLAVVRALGEMGGPGRAAAVILIIPRPLRDLVYDLVARIRYRWFGRFEACPIPPADVRARFLD